MAATILVAAKVSIMTGQGSNLRFGELNRPHVRTVGLEAAISRSRLDLPKKMTQTGSQALLAMNADPTSNEIVKIARSAHSQSRWMGFSPPIQLFHWRRYMIRGSAVDQLASPSQATPRKCHEYETGSHCDHASNCFLSFPVRLH